MDHFCYLCFVFVNLSCLFIAALWSPAGKGLISWFHCVLCFLEFLSLFPLGVLGQVWSITVSISGLCLLAYLHWYFTEKKRIT